MLSGFFILQSPNGDFVSTTYMKSRKYIKMLEVQVMASRFSIELSRHMTIGFRV